MDLNDARNLETIRGKAAFIIDMDGVIYHGNRLLRGAAEFVAWLQARGKRFLFGGHTQKIRGASEPPTVCLQAFLLFTFHDLLPAF